MNDYTLDSLLKKYFDKYGAYDGEVEQTLEALEAWKDKAVTKATNKAVDRYILLHLPLQLRLARVDELEKFASHQFSFGATEELDEKTKALLEIAFGQVGVYINERIETIKAGEQ